MLTPISPINPEAAKAPIIPICENIPSELTTSTQWANWRSIPGKDGDKPTMQLYQPNGSMAIIDDSWIWDTFDTVKAAADRFDGVGFVLTQELGVVGLGFNHCRCPAFDGVGPGHTLLILSYLRWPTESGA